MTKMMSKTTTLQKIVYHVKLVHLVNQGPDIVKVALLGNLKKKQELELRVKNVQVVCIKTMPLCRAMPINVTHVH